MKSNLDKHFKQDSSQEKDGIWFELDGGIRFRLRRFGGSNTELKKAMVRHYKPKARLIEKGLLSEAEERSIVAKSFISACMIDWEGVEVDGELVPYSFDVAVELFKGLPELLETLMEYAQDSENYREEVGN